MCKVKYVCLFNDKGYLCAGPEFFSSMACVTVYLKLETNQIVRTIEKNYQDETCEVVIVKCLVRTNYERVMYSKFNL